MKVNPFLDAWQFILGLSPDQLALGAARPLFVFLFDGLLLASVLIAIAAWRADPGQRTAARLWTWLCRVLIGSMWFQGSLWKLPLPVSGGLQYWTEQMVKNAAFPFVSDLVQAVMLPNLAFFDPLVFLLEIALAASFITGLLVRPLAVIGALYTLGLWIGLYRHPTEWPWEYIFLAVVQALFAVYAAGYSLGLDAIIRRRRHGASAPGLGWTRPAGMS